MALIEKNANPILVAIRVNHQHFFPFAFYHQRYQPTKQSQDVLLELINRNEKLCQCVTCHNYLLWDDAHTPHETGCQCDIVLCDDCADNLSEDNPV